VGSESLRVAQPLQTTTRHDLELARGL
jgi:hypothetical protein